MNGTDARNDATNVRLTEVFRDDEFQLTGLSVSKMGRLFVNYPRWSDRYENAVVEVNADGSTTPFPDETWNRWDLKPDTVAEHFVCVQSVVVDANDVLWVLDAGAPLLGPAIPHAAKLVAIDLTTNRVQRTIAFAPDVALPDSYMNDIRIDLRTGAAYLTDSGHGGIVVVDLASGRAHRALDGHPSVMAEPGVKVIVNGKELLQNGKPPQFRSDGIALSNDGSYLSYKAITANTLYRIETAILRDAKASPDIVAAAVEVFATIFPTDGLWTGADDSIYTTDVSRNAVTRVTLDGNASIVVQDDRLQWPDTFSAGPDGAIYVSASHINESPPFNKGRSVRTSAYGVYRFTP
jgi:sugar lactone lactonase YvrE